MTYVIAEPCIGEKNGACVDVCPAGCIHTTPDAPQNYIDPAVCIECEQCVLVCPVNAVFLDKELPGEWLHFSDVNAAFFQANKPVGTLNSADAAAMVHAVADYAGRAGLMVAVTVLDRDGLALARYGDDAAATDESTRKAYTALMYGMATHELKSGSQPLWRSPAEIDVNRSLLAPGGYPIIEGVETLGAVGVAGAPHDQAILCCQAALESRFTHSSL
jgi:ferredoxin